MKKKKILIGTRRSALALAQAEAIAQRLRDAWPTIQFELSRISTTGDRDRSTPLALVAGKGVFTREIDLALQRGEVDLAVHSMKDVPIQLPDNICIGAVPERAAPHDVAITRDGHPLNQLAAGSTIGTSSLRRRAHLRAWREDIRIVDLRGNLDTRIRKLDQGLVDAIVVAAAGLQRLNIDRQVETIPFSIMLPAPAQGALAVTARENDINARELLEPLNHPPSADAVAIERAILEQLGGGCQVPLGAYAEIQDDGIFTVRVAVFPEDDGRPFRALARGWNPAEACQATVTMLREQGLEIPLRST